MHQKIGGNLKGPIGKLNKFLFFCSQICKRSKAYEKNFSTLYRTVCHNCLPTSVVDPIQELFGQVGTVISDQDLASDLTFFDTKESVKFVQIFPQNAPNSYWITYIP
jgi:hypothetical protein